MRSHRLFWLPALFWMGLIFWLSSSPDMQGAADFIDLRAPWDKAVHAAAFGVLALLLHFATGRVLLALLLTTLYGVSDEVHQAFVPGRSADPLDWLADTLGAALALGLVAFLTRGRSGRREPLE